MDTAARLQPGSPIRCPHCRLWRTVIKPYNVGTEYTRRMLFIECGNMYYAGQEDYASRHLTRSADVLSALR